MSPVAKRAPERPPDFAERLSYLRFLKHLQTGRAPTNREIGDAAGVTDAAVIGWVRRNAPPPAYEHVMALLAYFGIQDRERWFIAGEGEPPEPELWKRWLAERQRETEPPATMPKSAFKTRSQATKRRGDERAG